MKGKAESEGFEFKLVVPWRGCSWIPPRVLLSIALLLGESKSPRMEERAENSPRRGQGRCHDRARVRDRGRKGEGGRQLSSPFLFVFPTSWSKILRFIVDPSLGGVLAVSLTLRPVRLLVELIARYISNSRLPTSEMTTYLYF